MGKACRVAHQSLCTDVTVKIRRSAVKALTSQVTKKNWAPCLVCHPRPRASARTNWPPKRWGAVEHAPNQPSLVCIGPRSAWRCARRGLTPRSSRAPTAKRQARATVHVIICSAGLAFCRWVRLNSNVRPQNPLPAALPHRKITAPVSGTEEHDGTEHSACLRQGY